MNSILTHSVIANVGIAVGFVLAVIYLRIKK